jgi:hypothetical protein
MGLGLLIVGRWQTSALRRSLKVTRWQGFKRQEPLTAKFAKKGAKAAKKVKLTALNARHFERDGSRVFFLETLTLRHVEIVKGNAKAEPATEMPRSLPQEHCIRRAKTARPENEPPHHMLFRPGRRKKMFTRSGVVCNRRNGMLQNFTVSKRKLNDQDPEGRTNKTTRARNRCRPSVRAPIDLL